MARRRNKHSSRKRKSTKCPEPINTMIDIAALATLGLITGGKKKKGNQSKIDPYMATGVSMGMGKLKTTEDIIRFGGMLGAMGAFDEDESSAGFYSGPHDNRYAWRLNCEDGSEYGIDPDDYETREEYNEALEEAMDSAEEEELEFNEEDDEEDEDDFFISAPLKTAATTSAGRICCRVSRLDNGVNQYYIAPDNSYKVGDRVTVPTDDGKTVSAIIISVEPLTDVTMMEIIGHE